MLGFVRQRATCFAVKLRKAVAFGNEVPDDSVDGMPYFARRRTERRVGG